MGRLPSDDEVNAYITQRSSTLGINPRVSVDISQAERGSRTSGWIGDNGSSFGPFQLHLGGIAGGGNSGPGLGDMFVSRTGLDPRNIADTWKQQVDFALQWARDVSGWEPFHAASTLGYGKWDGIRQAVGNTVAGLKYYFPIQGYTGDPHKTYHTPGATDLFAPLGTPIRDIADGRVETVGSTGPGGNNLIIKGLDGLDYYYAHMQEPPNVHPGDYVAAGQVIGKVGQTGNAAGKDPHLHLGIGYGIASGTGAAGGAGQNFDAQTFLSNILATGGDGAPIHESVTQTGQQIAAWDIGGQIRAGLGAAGHSFLQDLQNYTQERAASIVLLTLGILLVLGGIWGMAMNNGTVRTVAKGVAGTIGGPVGIAASVA